MRARSFLYAAAAGAFLLGSLDLANAAEKEMAPKPDATMTISAKALAAGAGYTWGGGKLHYKGKTYDVSVDGLTVGAVGISSITASAKVFNLKKLEDFDGNYTAVAVGSTTGGGGGGVTMQNQNGVQVRMKATTKGVSLTIGVSGVTLALEK